MSKKLHGFGRVRQLELSSIEFPVQFFQAVAKLPHLEPFFTFDIFFSLPISLNPLVASQIFATLNHQPLDDHCPTHQNSSFFFEFLTLCPVLEEIAIENISQLEHIISVDIPVRASVAPQLSSFQGPPFLAAVLTPSRPITSITIFGDIHSPVPRMVNLLTSLSLGSAPLTKLDLDYVPLLERALRRSPASSQTLDFSLSISRTRARSSR
ncbi:hypothetical protein CPB83DRAFT_908460 [Crepidotus variabilis]|uniref:Uncharacterized protein n=1 Tax=Crepidotus variabilis TaxID=179855 RepID=A0A9P6JMI7_9AGAR|nr:hypothetical protein CPB83DRAFT_908460 [Crepidotus variabilis]